MKNSVMPPLEQLQNGVLVPSEGLIVGIHNVIISYRKELGKEDPPGIRDKGILNYLCDSLRDRMHKYKANPFENALYVATETFYFIACQHPFVEANKSTAYVSALVILYSNLANQQKKLGQEQIFFEFHHDQKEFVNAPQEAQRITQLAEGGEEDPKLKKLIKEFLINCLAENEFNKVYIDELLKEIINKKKAVLKELADK